MYRKMRISRNGRCEIRESCEPNHSLLVCMLWADPNHLDQQNPTTFSYLHSTLSMDSINTYNMDLEKSIPESSRFAFRLHFMLCDNPPSITPTIYRVSHVNANQVVLPLKNKRSIEKIGKTPSRELWGISSCVRVECWYSLQQRPSRDWCCDRNYHPYYTIAKWFIYQS